MSSIEPFLAQIEASALATTIQGSTFLNGVLSGLHLVGLTLLLGSVFVTGAAVAGLLGPYPVGDLTRAARRGSLGGLALSMATGLLLVSPRAVSSLHNPTFQLKMGLLVTGTVVLLAAEWHAARHGRSPLPATLVAVAGVAVWSGVALAGLAFILLE